MKWVFVLERGGERVEVFGPFDSKDLADAYARAKFGHQLTIWRTTELIAPEPLPST